MRTSLSILLWLPSVALASGGGGHGDEGIPWTSIEFHALNLAILLGFLIWLARRPISDALKNRSAEVRRAIEDAQKAQREAQALADDLERRLSTFQSEVARLQRETREEAEKERVVILERAEKEAEAIRAAAERAIREETHRARRALQEEAVQLAVQMASDMLRDQVNADDQSRLARELMTAVHHDIADGRVDGRHNGE